MSSGRKQQLGKYKYGSRGLGNPQQEGSGQRCPEQRKYEWTGISYGQSIKDGSPSQLSYKLNIIKGHKSEDLRQKGR
ncbi:hypothetical protein [Pontibacter anaerobius]|uniref:Uncharacterized protein n=1 Tax=Pontibacter anaerobius TaxID=2993940 RepID=A0ABT3RGI7_9BACT|nr:hypothetical protein [Pontibacter anaerobius]MCX2740598.1 hypothetical protein [Pontibacter anaerobius]